MDKSKLTLLALAASAALTGCEPAQPSADEERAYVEDEAQKQVRQTLASDEEDRKKTLAELQSKDPSVKDVYFSYNEKGEKQVHIVKETADGQNSDTVWPLLGGMAAGYMLASAMNSMGGMNAYSQRYQPVGRSTYAEDERRRRMNSVSSANTTMMMNSARNSVRSSPNFQSKMSSTVMSSRSTGVMSGSSARAASHGSASS
ncbi:hypothetical protein [Streptomyces sp. CHB9.2]|uniref:hypothetical protein n=1 Tax=Streptomyces sp. CHB9.2 TaxID=2841670 RepID=UPI0020954778|nr:hypothetical protein [Streptomyces sp. CHB9.2]MCO6704761.1 hypothetical protein [Streptomyces sp. CHB9.2]